MGDMYQISISKAIAKTHRGEPHRDSLDDYVGVSDVLSDAEREPVRDADCPECGGPVQIQDGVFSGCVYCGRNHLRVDLDI